MTTERDPRTRIVLSWLREEAHENAERVLLRALDEVDATPQRRSRWPAWRTNRMNAYAKLIAAAAAVLVVAIGGYQLLPWGSGLGGSRPTQATLTAPSFGRAGNGVIAVAKDGDILVADRPGGALRALVAGPEDDRSPMFSPDGTRLAFLRDTELGSLLMIADADGANVVQLTPETLNASRWSFAPDGRSLVGVAVIDGQKRAVVRPVDPAAELTILEVRLPGAQMDIEDPSFRPTNPQEILVVAQLDADGPRGIYVYDLATGGIRTIVEPAAHGQYVDNVAWFPDGEHIIYDLSGIAGTRPRIVAPDGSGDEALDAADGRVRRVPPSNDGTRIVAERGGAGEAAPQSMVVRIDGDGEPVVLACGPGTDIECPSSWIWSPDDSMLIGGYLLADPDTGQVAELDWDVDGIPAWQRVAP